MLISLSVLLVGVFILMGVLLAWSPGKPELFVDGNGKPLAGSISEKVFVNINDVQQGMFIKSRDVNNPVLLFVHGGPGMPEYWLTQRCPTGLEDYFTVAWWEQHGAGPSYNPNITAETITDDSGTIRFRYPGSDQLLAQAFR